MLVLARKRGDKVRIGADVVVTVVDVRGDKVRIGISAPDGVKILRTELVLENPEIESQLKRVA